ALDLSTAARALHAAAPTPQPAAATPDPGSGSSGQAPVAPPAPHAPSPTSNESLHRRASDVSRARPPAGNATGERSPRADGGPGVARRAPDTAPNGPAPERSGRRDGGPALGHRPAARDDPSSGDRSRPLDRATRPGPGPDLRQQAGGEDTWPS